MTITIPTSALMTAVRGGRRRPATTPERILRLSALTIVSGALLLTAGMVALLNVLSVTSHIRERAVPAVAQAQQLRIALAEADHAAANAFLSGGTGIDGPGQDYQSAIQTAMHQVVLATEHDNAGPPAIQQLQEISAELAQYASMVDTARATNRQGAVTGGATYLSGGSQLMHWPGDGPMARAEAVEALEARALAREGTRLGIMVSLWGIYLVIAIALLSLLGHTQRFVRHRFHRRWNLRLLAASVLVCVQVAWVAAQAVASEVMRHQAVAAYTQLHNVLQARTLADEANGAQSLSLVAGVNRRPFDEAYQTATRQLRQQLATVTRAAPAGPERQAANRATRSFDQFLRADAAIRAMARSSPQDAVTAALGSRPDQLHGVFVTMDRALAEASQSAHRRFERALAGAGMDFGLRLGLPLLTVAVVYLAYSGLKPRLEEYRAP